MYGSQNTILQLVTNCGYLLMVVSSYCLMYTVQNAVFISRMLSKVINLLRNSLLYM